MPFNPIPPKKRTETEVHQILVALKGGAVIEFDAASFTISYTDKGKVAEFYYSPAAKGIDLWFLDPDEIAAVTVL